MRLRRLSFLLACCLSGCRDATAPDTALLIGNWARAPEISRFDGSTSLISLGLRDDGTFMRAQRVVDAAGVWRSSTVSEGTFTIRDDSLFLRTSLVRTQDRDSNGGTVTTTPSDGGFPYGPFGARVEVRRDSLIIHYLSYPLPDVVVESTESFARLVLVDFDVR